MSSAADAPYFAASGSCGYAAPVGADPAADGEHERALPRADDHVRDIARAMDVVPLSERRSSPSTISTASPSRTRKPSW